MQAFAPMLLCASSFPCSLQGQLLGIGVGGGASDSGEEQGSLANQVPCLHASNFLSYFG
jgi:hypothetical protein